LRNGQSRLCGRIKQQNAPEPRAFPSSKQKNVNSNQTVVVHPQQRLQSAVDVQLSVNAVQMDFDRRRADAHFVRNHFVWHPLSQTVHHFDLSGS